MIKLMGVKITIYRQNGERSRPKEIEQLNSYQSNNIDYNLINLHWNKERIKQNLRARREDTSEYLSKCNYSMTNIARRSL
jgi:hypothetical protein